MIDEYVLKVNAIRQNNFRVLTYITCHAIITSLLAIVLNKTAYIPLYIAVVTCLIPVYILMRFKMEMYDMALYSKPDRPIITAEDVLKLLSDGNVAAPLNDHMALFYFSSAKRLFAVETERINNKLNIVVRPLHFQNISRMCGDFKRLGFDLNSCPVSLCNIRDCAGIIAYIPRRYMVIRNAYK